TYTYDEATGASGGLWSIKSGEPGTAVISKNIETTGVANLQGGVLLPDSSLITCDPTTAGIMARNASGGIDICNGATWDAISGAGGTDTFNSDNTVVCDATTAGQVRFNTTTELPEFCNGTDWLPFSINIPGINLVLSPQQQNGMDVDADNNVDPGISGICDDSIYYCGNPVTFTLTNSGTLPSSTIVISLTNSTNFYIKAETCTVAGGNADGILDPNESCIIDVIPKANGNVSYSSNLQVGADNNPFAIMQGTAVNFGCVPGRTGGGGVFAYCGLSSSEGDYNLIVTPGGCTSTTFNPTCAGGTDTKTAIYGASGVDFYNTGWIPYNDTIGARASVYAMAYADITGTSMPAIQWCDDLIYGGYDDWYLPAVLEFHNYIYPVRAVVGGITNQEYNTSTYSSSSSNMYLYRMNSGDWATYGRNVGYRIRCARRDNIPLPSVTDGNPTEVAIQNAIVFSSGGSSTSNTVTIAGIFDPVSASISGGTGMDIVKNGLSTGSTSISGLTWGNTLAFTMDAPTVLGTKNTATITIGSDTYTWWVGYADPSVTAKVFVTKSSYYGYNGGLSTYDTYCNSNAAVSTLGLSAKWKAILSDETVNAYDRIPWNWKTLTKVDGTVVVNNGITDLFDGSLLSAIDLDQNGDARVTDVHTGSNADGSKKSGYTASSWTTSYASLAEGSSASSSSTWLYKGSDSSSYQNAIYCIEDVDDISDVTPSSMKIPYKTQVALSSVITSDQVAVGGMSNGATQTLSVSATGGSPNFDVEREAVTIASGVTSYSVKNGDKITFHITSPATASTSYKMTATAGTTTSSWRVWTGPSSSGVVKRVFVTSTSPSGSSFGGASGADTQCQSRASAASLGGTWKAILSGTAETDWAVNRVGYNWDELRLVDNTTVVVNTVGGLWSTLLHAIDMDEYGNAKSSARILSGTKSDGSAYSTISDLSNLYNWTGSSCSATYMQGNSSALSAVITQGYWLCQSDGSLFCIEQ
ncbi:MAG: hypothetical protein PHX61_13035, partial [Alphaproteobacteria bacterium]|nr:hypothetical protein [Alphaproteobacteria bacterium]